MRAEGEGLSYSPSSAPTQIQWSCHPAMTLPCAQANKLADLAATMQLDKHRNEEVTKLRNH